MKPVRNPGDVPIAGYKLVRPLGVGGFGEVWECEAPGGIQKAIKFVRGKLNTNDDQDLFAEQEHRALQVVKDVRHPFVLSIERIDIHEGEIVIVMELADSSLQDELVEVQKGGQIGIPRDRLIAYLADAAEGLDYMIDKFKLQHLDVKPRNLFVIGDRVKVADFGLVKSLDRRVNAGLLGGASPLYAAPETFTGKLSRCSDQYSLGINYMELLTGKFPFHGRSLRQLAMQHLQNEPDLRALPERDRAAVARALSKDPAKRFPSSSAFIKSLRESPSERVELFGSQDEGDKPWDDSIPLAHAIPDASLVDSQSIDIASLAPLKGGKLQPAVFVGVGGFGRRALVELRRRLSDRLGDPANLPIFRFLYLDADPEMREKATQGSPEDALEDQAVFPIPLQAPGKYRGRNRDHLSAWLPAEKLNVLTRSMQLNGSRALGRLSLYDNYLRISTRLRREIEQSMHPESVNSTTRLAGWEIGEMTPRVYVLASAIGGSSGMLPDLGYAIRRVLNQLMCGTAPLESFLFCGAPEDPATPLRDLANLYATLTEINHFHDGSIAFHAEFAGADGPKLDDGQEPWTGCYLIRNQARSPESMNDATSAMAGYLSQIVQGVIQLNHHQHEPRKSNTITSFRSFGISGAWFPRGLVLRFAAREATRRLLEMWQAAPGSSLDDAVKAKFAAIQSELQIGPQTLRKRFEDEIARGGRESATWLAAKFEVWSHEVQEGTGGRDPADWASTLLEEVTRQLGPALADASPAAVGTKGIIARDFSDTAYEIAQQWTDQLFAHAEQLSSLPGPRLARVEQFVTRVCTHLSEEATRFANVVRGKRDQVVKQRMDVGHSYQALVVGSGYSLFGRPTRAVKQFLDSLLQFARHRYDEIADETSVRCLRTIQSNLEERLRDLVRSRQRVCHLRDAIHPLPKSRDWPMPAASDKSPGGPMAMKLAPVDSDSALGMLLPEGNRLIPQAACEIVDRLRPGDWARFEDVLQTLVLQPMGGLIHVSLQSANLGRDLAQPLVEQGAAFLGSLVRFEGVFDLLRAGEGTQEEKMQDLLNRAEPPVGAADATEQVYMMVPNNQEDLHTTRLRTRSESTGVDWVNLPEAASEWLVIRERNKLRAGDLAELMGMCRDAYEQLSDHIASSPHARFDVQDWIPME